MEYLVRIDEFEGPLDLLLYLIKETKISIDKINVAQITKQYIDFIHSMEKLNLEVASEYLVMAAYLIFIKSKMMLPKASLGDEEIQYEENPEEKLKQRLKIYKLFKDVVPYLRDLEDERSNYLTKVPTDLSNEFKLDNKELITSNVSVYDLLSAYNKVLKRYQLHRPHKTKITQQSISIDERVDELKSYFKTNKRVCFKDIFTEDCTKEYIIVTFIALLELAKNKEIYLSQEDLYQDIYIDYIALERDDSDE